MPNRTAFRKTGTKKRPNPVNAVIIICAAALAILIFRLIAGRLSDNGRQADTPAPSSQTDAGEDALVAPFYPTRSTLGRAADIGDALRYLYVVDDTAFADESVINVGEFAQRDLTTDMSGDSPRILIFHTHSQEAFADSEKGNLDGTIVGVGQRLAEILAADYGIAALHDIGRYDVVNGKETREGSYERMAPAVEALLEKYPTIEVMLDIHRDGVPDDVRLVMDIDGKPTARFMFFNGILSLNDNGRPKKPEGLDNPYLRENLAFSLQAQLAANELYPGLTRKIYLKPYRYSLHMRPKSLLVEVGANTNTVEEAKNAMKPLAEVLVRVLCGDGNND